MEGFRGLPEVYEYVSGPFQGGMGRVYQVRHRDWGVSMAVKQPLPDTLGDPKVMERFERECALWVSLGLHRHIVQCHYVRRLAGVPTVFAQWMEGGSLDEGIRSGALYRGLETDERAVQLRLLDLAIQIARGMAFAHSRGLVHRDLKPANVMFDAHGTAKLTDFGLSALFRGSGEGESRGFGTLAYAPPEQQSGARCTPQSDLWSFGVVLLELFLGERLWRNCVVIPTGLEHYFAHSRVRVPEEVCALIRACCQSSPLRRPESFSQAQAQLLDCWRRLSGEDYPTPEVNAGTLAAGTWNNRALSYLDLQRPEEAEKCWKKALSADPGHLASVYNRTLFRWRRGEAEDLTALHALQNAYNAAPRRESALLLCHFFEERGSAAPIRRLNSLFGETLADPAPLADRERRQTLLRRPARSMSVCGDRVVLLLRNGSASVWDLKRCEGTVQLAAAGYYLHQMALLPEGGVCAAADEGVVCFSPEGKLVTRIPVPEGRVLHLCLLEGGRKVLLHASRRDGDVQKEYFIRLRLSDGARERKIRVQQLSADPFLPLNDGHALLLRAGNRLLRLDLDAGKLTGRFETAYDVVLATLSADGTRLAAWDGETVQIWSIENTKRHTSFALAACHALCFARNGTLLLCAVERGAVQVRDTASGRCLRTFSGHGERVYALAAWEKGEAVLVADAQGVHAQGLPAFDRRALWQLSQVEDEGRLAADADRFQRLLRQAAAHWKRGEVRETLGCLRQARSVPGYARNSAYLRLNAAVGRGLDVKGLLSAWNRETARAEQIQPPDPCVCAVGGLLLRTDYDGTVRLLRSGDESLLRTVRAPIRGVTAAALSQDGRWAALGCMDGSTALLDLHTGALRWQQRGDGATVTALALLPRSGYLLAGCGNGAVLVRAGADGSLCRVLTGHSGAVRAISCSPDGLMARTDGEDGLIQIWQFDYEYAPKKEETP